MWKIVCALVTVTALAACKAETVASFDATQPPRMTETIMLELTVERHGLDGKLAFRRDNRLTTDHLAALQAFYWFGTPMDAELQENVEAYPLMDAELKVLNTRGEEIQTYRIDTPFAELNAAKFAVREADDWLLFKAYGGYGMFNGKKAEALTVTDGRVRPMSLPLAEGQITAQPLELLNEGKTSWRLIQDGTVIRAILQIQCRPDVNDPKGFLELYTRYLPTPEGFVKHENYEWGYCEWPTDGFPPMERFPALSG